MTQFRIDVVVNPSRAVKGIKGVEQGLKSADERAKKLEGTLKKAFAGLSLVFAIRQLTEFGDAFTNLQNRLRVVTSGTAELNSVTEQLLQVSNRSRSSFESTSELYSRLALATRELNLEGANLINVTESINKAIILSGASAKEANNGLIQLSQGLASGRLTGDELRSTLEQLPVVADVIARQLGVTRGELRKLGAEGKITSIQIIKAFQAAEKDLEASFADTVPTISQSFVVLRNNVVAFVGRINEGTGILRTFGDAIRAVGENLEVIVKSLALVGVTAAAVKLAPIIQSFFALQGSIEAVTVARARSSATINLQNKLILEQARANTVAAAAELKRTDGIIRQARIESISNAIKKGGNALLFEKAVVTKQLAGVEAQRTGQLAALIAAEKAEAAANLAASKNVTLFSRAMDGAKKATRAFTAAIASNPVGAFVVALTAIIAALVIFRNNIKLTSDGAATLGDLFTELFDQIGAALSQIGSLFSDAFGPAIDSVKDVVGVVEFEFADLIKVPALFVDRFIGLFLGLVAAVPPIFKSLPAAIGDVFVTIVNFAIQTLEFIPDALIGILKEVTNTIAIFITGQVTAFSLLGAAAKQALVGNFSAAADFTEQAAKLSADAAKNAVDGFGQRVALSIADEVNDELIPRLKNPFEEGFANIGKGALDAFVDAATFSGVSDFVSGLITGAEQIAQDREAVKVAKEKAEADKQAAIASAERTEAIEKILNPIIRENELLGQSIALGSREAQIREQIRVVTEKLAAAGARYNFVQLLAIQATIRQQAARQEALQTAQSLQTAEQVLTERLRELKNAYDQGTISLQVYNEAQREAELVALEASTTFADGWEAGLQRAIDKFKDFGSVAQNIITQVSDGLVNSLGETFQATFGFIADTLTNSEASWVDYREAIKATFKSLIDGILAELAKLLAQKALLALLNPAGSAAGAVGGGLLSPSAAGFNFAAEGSPAAPANKPFIVGEEGPEIFTPGQTGSITPTDQTISALTNGAANNRETMVIQAPAPEVNVNTIVVDDPSKVPTGIQSPDGRQAIRNVIREERSGIKRDLG